MTAKHRAFTLIEVILSATLLTIIATPILLAITNLGFQYRNLQSNYYGQLIAQSYLERMTNILQGSNPLDPNVPDVRTDNTFCDNLNLACNQGSTFAETHITSNMFIDLPQYDEDQNQYPFDDPQTNQIDIQDIINSTTFTTNIILSPVCRDGQNLVQAKNPNGTCISPSIQDRFSVEVIITTSYDPPGPQNIYTYELRSIFTEFYE